MNDKISFDGVELDVETVRSRLAAYDSDTFENLGGSCGIRVGIFRQNGRYVGLALQDYSGRGISGFEPDNVWFSGCSRKLARHLLKGLHKMGIDIRALTESVLAV